MTSELESDRDLMRRVAAGETDCFAELVRRYQGPLRRVAASRLGRDDLAEEAVQETFLAAFRSRGTYREQFGFRTWLWTILLNQCRGMASRAGRSPKVGLWSDEGAASREAALIETSIARSEPPPLARLLAVERSALLNELLDRLTAAQADALRLRFFGELTFAEIAETLGCSLLTAKNRVKAGLLKLSQWTVQHEAAEGRRGERA